jgi:adenylate cyclase class IV
MKKPKARRYELMSMKIRDFMGKTEVLAQLSLDELNTIGRIAKALAADESGVLLDTVKKHVKFWESAGKNPAKQTKRGGRQ